MNSYKQLTDGFLMHLYEEIWRKIKKGTLSKNMYYELGIIYTIAVSREIYLELPSDFNQMVNQQVLNSLLQAGQNDGKPICVFQTYVE